MLVRAITLWLLYDLTIPSLLLVFNPNIGRLYFNSYSNVSVAITFLIWACLYLFMLRPVRRLVFFKRKTGKFLAFFSKKIFEAILIIFFLSSIYFFTQYDMSFRHLNRIKNTNSIVMLMFALRPFFRLWLLVETFKLVRGKIPDRRIVIVGLVLGLSFFFSTTSASDMITIIMCLALVLSPRIDVESFYKVKLFSVKSLLVFFVFCSVIFVGFANKKNAHQRINAVEFVDDFVESFMDPLIARLSVHTVSTYIAVESAHSFSNYATWIYEVMFTQVNNGYKLLGDDYKDKINTLARRNYFLLFSQARDSSRTGTSPGFLASFLYIPFFPINVLLGVIFLRFVFSRIYHGLSAKRVPVILLIISVFVLAPFLDGFQHVLFIIDPISISFFYYVLITDNYVSS